MVVYSFFFRKHIHIQTTHCGRFAIWTTFGFLTGVVVPRCTRWSRVAIWTIFTFTFTFTFTGGAKVHPLVEGRNLDNFHFHFHFHWWCQGAPVGRGSRQILLSSTPPVTLAHPVSFFSLFPSLWDIINATTWFIFSMKLSNNWLFVPSDVSYYCCIQRLKFLIEKFPKSLGRLWVCQQLYLL